MFKEYSLPVKIGFVAAIVIAIILIVWLSNYNKSKAQDINMVIQTKSLATALERYYDKFNSYPNSSTINLSSLMVLTENGINQEGDTMYFRRDFEWARSGKYFSDGNNYAIDFDLEHSWAIWGLDGFGGGKCRVATNVTMGCIKAD